jgi:hypothetical protein
MNKSPGCSVCVSVDTPCTIKPAEPDGNAADNQSATNDSGTDSARRTERIGFVIGMAMSMVPHSFEAGTPKRQCLLGMRCIIKGIALTTDFLILFVALAG